MYRHRSLPIIDFINNGRKYRCVFESSLIELKYSYVLYELDNDQSSMIDGLELEEKLPNNNPIIKFSMKNFLTPNSKIPKEKFYSSKKIGELKELNNNYFDTSQSAVFITQSTATESIFSVDKSALVNICLGLVLKRFKDEQRQRNEGAVITSTSENFFNIFHFLNKNI